MTANPDRSDWSVQTLGDFLQAQQECNEERVRGIYERDQISQAASMEAVSKRLDALGDLYNRSIEQSLRGVTREEFDRAINAERERLEESVAPLSKQLAESGKPNWVLLVGLVSVVLVVLSGCWLLIGLQINVSITPQSLALEQAKTAQNAQGLMLSSLEARLRAAEVSATSSTASDAESRTDRARMNTRITTLEGGLSQAITEEKAFAADFKARLVEIETQFCAGDSIRNLNHAYDMRIMSMLWARGRPGETFPTDNAFYPVVCNRFASTRDLGK